MNFTEVGFGVPEWTLNELQAKIRLAEVTGRKLLAISRLSQQPGITPRTVLTYEFTGAAPASEVALIAYDGVTLPNLAGRTAICIGECVLGGKDDHVVAVR